MMMKREIMQRKIRKEDDIKRIEFFEELDEFLKNLLITFVLL